MMRLSDSKENSLAFLAPFRQQAAPFGMPSGQAKASSPFRWQRYIVFPTNPNLRQYKSCLKRHDNKGISHFSMLFHPDNRICHQELWLFQIKAVPLHPLEPAKPLNDAQMCGSFFYIQ
jgi:hypothetical protein